MGRALTWAVSFSLLAGLLTPARVPAQAVAPELKPELALLLEPDGPVEGLPRRFVLVITNVSDVTLRVPAPILGCSSPTATGSVVLNESWQPQAGPGLGTGSGSCCSGGSLTPAAPLLEQVQLWRVLRPGESMSLPLGSGQFASELRREGVYTFSATYFSPEMTMEALQTLRAAGIAVPHGQVTSDSLAYRR